jgi:hypothetical protein
LRNAVLVSLHDRVGHSEAVGGLFLVVVGEGIVREGEGEGGGDKYCVGLFDDDVVRHAVRIRGARGMLTLFAMSTQVELTGRP